MRILIANTYHFPGGGDSTYTFNLAELLRSHGHEVAFFAMQNERNLPDENSDLFVSPIDFRELNQNKSISGGIQVLRRSIYSFEAQEKFSKLLNRFHPDIVHLQNIHAHITPSVIFEAKKHGLPVVWTVHDFKLICPNSHFLIDKNNEICEACAHGSYFHATLKRCKKNSLLASLGITLEAYTHQILQVRKKVDRFLAPSRFLQQKLINAGFDSQKTIYLPLFMKQISTNHSEAATSERYFLFLGRLEQIKGVFTLIEAAKQIPHIPIKLAGRADESVTKQLIGQMPANVQYVGMKTGAELDELRNNSFAFVIPSIWYENQPFAILEAFAIGKPVIGSKLGGIVELIGNNERGILTAPGNAQELANALKKAWNEPNDVHDKGQEGLKYVISNFSASTHYERIIKIYSDLVPRGNKTEA